MNVKNKINMNNRVMKTTIGDNMNFTNKQRARCTVVRPSRCALMTTPSRSAVAVALALATFRACATDFDTGIPDLSVRWDNTVKYSAARRLEQPLPSLLGNPNTDDGDRNFHKGLISNRFDLFSELDVVYKNNMGFRLSGAGWYDPVYLRANSNPGFAGGAVPNQTSVPYNEFPRKTREIHGRDAELLDAFVFGKFDVAGHNTTVRAGRHSLLWGESLFFGTNAISGGQMPVDAVKLVSVPNTQFKEAIRQVPMLSGQFQINAAMSVGAYVQFASSKVRAPAVGSYFSAIDVAVDGAENLFTGSFAPRQKDREARRGGQGGLQFKLRDGDVDYGVYAIQFHDKGPQLVINLGSTGPTSYYQAYHEGIRAFGASVSRSFGDFNVASELSLRTNQDLASTRAVDLSAIVPVSPSNNSDNPAYAVGRTAHLNVSVIGIVPSTPLWREASLAAEFAWNRVLSVTRNPGATDPNASRDGTAFRALFEPTYRAVLSGLDVGVPIGLGYAPKGSRPLFINGAGWIPENGGDLTVGLNAVYLDAWRASLSYTHYYGPASTTLDAAGHYGWRQNLKDRDFIAASVRYTF